MKKLPIIMGATLILAGCNSATGRALGEGFVKSWKERRAARSQATTPPEPTQHQKWQEYQKKFGCSWNCDEGDGQFRRRY